MNSNVSTDIGLAESDETLIDVVIVTGMTGAGRSSASKVLEQLGYYVVDNIPPRLLGETIDLVDASPTLTKLAAVIDVRSQEFFHDIFKVLEGVRADRRLRPRLLFLEAADDILVRRQEAARKPHPLSVEGRLGDGFQRERQLLEELRGRADIVIDSSNLSLRQLVARVRESFEDPDTEGLRASIVSFGFKYGIPIDADMVADMRFLPNPYWEPELRLHSGQDDVVREYVLRQPRAQEFLQRYEELVALLTDGFINEDKHFLSIAIGCTGGRHRSVAMAEAFGTRLRKHQVKTLVVHRDLGRE